MSAVGTIVFRESVDRVALASVATRLGWSTAGDVPRGHFVMSSQRFTTSDGTTVEYLEDHTSDVRFAKISGPSTQPVMSLLRESLPSYDAEELLRTVPRAEGPREWIHGLSRLAIYRPEETHAQYLAVWSRGLNHPETSVRRAAIRTSYGCRWPELAALITGRTALERELSRPLENLINHLKGLHRTTATKHPSA